MKKLLAVTVVASALLLSGCGMGAPSDINGIKQLKEFRIACEEAGGQLDRDSNGIYRCYMDDIGE